MTLWVGLTHPALTKLTFMDYLLTMLRNRLRRKHGCDNFFEPPRPPPGTWRRAWNFWPTSMTLYKTPTVIPASFASGEQLHSDAGTTSL